MSENQVYWLTRDEDHEGTVSEQVDVWLARPHRISIPGGGAMWLGPDESGIEKRYAMWTLDNARKNVPGGAVPDNSRESIKVG